MNKVFQLVWNHFSRTWVAAGETAKRNTKGRYAVDGILAALAALGVGISSAKPKAKNSQAFGLSCMTVALAMAQGGMVYAATPAPTALPTGAQIAAGQANIVQQNNTLTVQQQTDKLITNWQSFDIGSQATVNFQQPSSDSVALNRITNQDPTQILGNLNANGQIFLLNPAGIIIGNEAQVNVNTLVAITLSMTDQDFLDENYALTGDPNSLSKIVNQGTITTPEGGRVALIAPVVENQGDIITPNGSTALAAASEVELDLSGQGTLGIRIDKGTLNALVENEQLIQANNGQVILTARAVDALTKSVVNNDGIIEATSLTSKGGRIVLEGDDINLGSDTAIDASGETGGGEVLIGGDWQGSGDMHQAETVTMDAGAEIHADAITRGNGGKVVLWSDINNPGSLTEVHGEITARGGVQDGDGGQIETSGANVDIKDITVDASSTANEAGEWLIDPYDYVIGATEAAAIESTLNTGTSVTVETSVNNSSYGSNGNNASSGNITVTSAIAKTAGGDATLTLKAHHYVSVGQDVSSTSGKLNLVLWSDIDGNNTGFVQTTNNLTTNGGHVWLGGGDGSSTWNGLTVGDDAAAGYNASGWLGILANGNITTSGGSVYMAAKTSVTAADHADFSNYSGNLSINTGSGSIEIYADDIDLDGTASSCSTTCTTTVTTTGTLTLAPFGDYFQANESSSGSTAFTLSGTGSNFVATGSLTGLTINNMASLGGLTVGKDISTTNANVTVSSDLSIDGKLTIYGGDVILSNNITTAGGDVYIKAAGSIDQDGNNSATTTHGGSVVYWSNFNGANLGYIRPGNVNTGGGHVWMGGGTGNRIWNGLTVGNDYANDSRYAAVALRGNIDTRTSNNTIGGDVWLAGESGQPAGGDIEAESTHRTISAGNGDIIISAYSLMYNNASYSHDMILNTTGQISLAPLSGDSFWSSTGNLSFHGTMSGTTFVGTGDGYTYTGSGNLVSGIQIQNFANITGLNLGTYNGTGIVGDTAYVSANTQPVDIDTAVNIKGAIRAFGGGIWVRGDLDTRNASSAASIELTSSKFVAASANTDFHTDGGNITLWSNTGNVTSGQTNNEVSLGGTNILSTNGGHITLAGGLDNGANGGTANDGIPDNYAYRGDYSGAGVYIASGAVFESAGGNIIMRGHGVGASNPYGIQTGDSLRIDSGTGSITMHGSASTQKGLMLGSNSGTVDIAISSASTAATAISITGTTTHASYYALDLVHNTIGGNLLIQSTGATGGDIEITGNAASTWAFHNRIDNGRTQILTNAGDITFTASGDYGFYTASNSGFYLGQRYDATPVNGITPTSAISSGDITLKSTAGIYSEDAIIINTGDSNTVGGNVILASDTDATGGGNISFFSGALSVNTYGGDITLGGGDASATGYALGTADGNNDGSGIYFNNGGTLDTSGNSTDTGGDITLRGKGLAGSVSNSVAAAGINFYSGSTLINAGTGKVSLSGIAQQTNTGTSYGIGIYFFGSGATITSANTSNSAITLLGDASTALSTYAEGIFAANSGNIEISATGVGGGIDITSIGGTNDPEPMAFTKPLYVLANGGDINITTYSNATNATFLNSSGSPMHFGATSAANTTYDVTSSSSNITITTTALYLNDSANVNTSGEVVIQPYGNDFVRATDLSNLTISGTPSGLRIGKSATGADGTNDVDVTFAGGTIGGDISIYAREIDLTGALTKNAGSEANLLFKASNNVSSTANITSSSDKLNVILWSDADGDGDGRVYISNNINTNGGGVWVGGSYSSHGDGTSWTPYAGGTAITVGDGYASTPNNANSAIYAPSGTITTADGHITMYGYSNDDVGSGNYGINLKGLNLDSAAGNIILKGVANSAETASTFAFGTYIHSGSNVTSTSGNISLTGTLGSASQFVRGSGIYIGSSAETTTATGDVEITSTTGSITITGSGESTGTGSDWRYGSVLYPRITDTLTIGSTSGHIAISGEGNFHNVTSTGGLTLQTSATTAQLNITSRTGNISLTGSSTQESTAAEHALRFISYNASNNIRIGYDGTNTYSGDITVKANSIYNTYNNSGSGSLAFVTSGDVFIRPEDGDTSFSNDLDISDDWTFGSGANSITIGTTTNTANVSIATDLVTVDPISLYAGDLTLDGDITTSAANAHVTINSNTLSIPTASSITTTGNVIMQPIGDDYTSDVSLTSLTVDASSFTLGKTNKSTDGTNDVNFVLANADITTANALTFAGKNVSFSGSATTTAANADIQVLATGYITNAAGSTFTTGSSSVTGGNVILASNIDDATDNDTTTNGYINMRHGIVINTHGGDITIGGGDTAGSGYASGGNFHNGTSYPYAEGVRFDTTFRLDSAGGDIAIRGKSYPVTVTTNYGAAAIGLYSLGANSFIDSGTGTINITGYSQTAGSTYSSGIITHSSSGHGLSITSANTTANAISLKGISTGTSGDAWGMEFNTDLSVTATGTGGGIRILTAQKNTTYNIDIVYRGTTDILAKSGPISLKGGQTLESVTGIANGKFYKEDDIFIGSKAGSAVTTSSSNLTIEYDTHNWNGGAKPAVATSGDILWQSANSTFGQYTATSWFTWDANGHQANSLIVGKASNTSDILIGENLTIAGDITIYGADINQQGNLDSSAGNGDITLYASEVYTGGYTGNRTVKSGTGNVSIYTESPYFDGGGNNNYNTTFTSTGHFTLAPFEITVDGFDNVGTQIEFQGNVSSGNFAGSNDINGLDIVDVANLTGLTIGKDGAYHATSTQGYYVYVDAGSTLNINGPINVFGKYVDLGDGIASTAAGADILLKAKDYIKVGADTDITTTGGDIILWADSDATNGGLINISDAGSGINITTTGGDIIMAGGTASNGLPSGSASSSGLGINFGSVTASNSALITLDTRKAGSQAGNVTLSGSSSGDDGIYLRNTKIYAHDLSITGETADNSDYGVSLWANAVASTLFDVDNNLTITATNTNGTSSTDYSLRTGANPRIYADGDISLISTGYLNYNSNQTDLEIKSGKTFTINAVNGTGVFTTPLIGAGSLYKDGTGTVTLSGSTNYNGDTTVNNGTLEVTGTLSNTGAVNVLANGILELSNTDTVGSITGAGNIVLNSGNTLTVGNSQNQTFSGVISGAGNLVKQGTGQLTLSGTSTYTGYTTVNVGTMLVSGTLSSGTALTVANGATYKLGASGTVGSITGAGDIELASFVLTAGGNNTSTTFDGLLSGTGGLTKSGTGTLTLTNDQTYTGNTTINAGSLQLGNGGTTGSVTGNIVNNSVLTFSYSEDQAVSNTISGTGDVTISSGYSSVLSQNLSSTPVTIASNAHVSEVLERIAGGELGGGAVNNGIASEGTVVLKSYDASTNSATFQVQIVDSNLTKAIFVKLQQNGNNVEALLDTSTMATGAAYLSGSHIGTDLSTGTSYNYQLDQLDVSAKITLTRANSYTGTTTVSTSTETGNTGSVSYTKTINSALQIGTGGTTGGSGGSAIVNNGIVIFNRSDNLTVNGAISGSGAITKVGSNTLTMTGNVTHTGNTYIGGGTLVIEDDTPNLATDFYGPGSLTVQSAGNSFTSALNSSSISYTDIGGLTIGKSTNTADITISDASINGAIAAYGGNIAVSGNLNTSTAGNAGDVLLKASGDLALAANKSITTNGGDVILWTNSDNSGDNGYILMRDGSSITTGGGHLWMGGGSGTSSWNGLSVGDGYAKAGALINSATFIGSSDGGVQSGIYLENANLNTAGGHVAMYGEGDDSGERGILSIGNFTLNAGAGKILLDAKSNNEISLIFGHHSVNTSSETVSLTTSNTAADAISITTTSTNIGTGWSYGTWVEGTANLLATNGGGISLTTAGAANGINLGYSNSAGTLNMFANSGDITLNTGANGINILTAGSAINLGRGGSTVTTSSSDLIVIADDFSSNGSLAFNTSGSLTVKPQAGNSFASTFDTSNLTYSSDVSGLTIGHADNTGDITIGSNITIAGAFTAYGGDITVSGNINTSTAGSSGDVLLKANDNIIVSTNKSITTSGGDITFWADTDTDGGYILVQNNVTLDSRTIADRTANKISTATNGGAIVMAGGADDGSNGGSINDGTPDGFAIDAGNDTIGAVQLGTNVTSAQNANITIYTGGGNLLMRGEAQVGSAEAIGVMAYEGINVDVGQAGNITLHGVGNISSGTLTHGINFGAYAGAASSPATSTWRTHNGDITITGTASGATTNRGVLLYAHSTTTPINMVATGTGDINIQGTAAHHDVIFGAANILAATGDITVTGNSTGNFWAAGRGINTLGYLTGSAVTNATGDITFNENSFNLASNQGLQLNTTGSVSLLPQGDDFGAAFSTTDIDFGNNIASLTIGDSSTSADGTNDVDVTLATTIDIDGAINVYGNNIYVNQNLDTTGGASTGDVLLKASQTIELEDNKSITTNGGDITFWADADNNGSGAVELHQGASLASGGGNITLGGGSDPLSDYAVGVSNSSTSDGIDGIGIYTHQGFGSINAGGGNISMLGIGTSGTDGCSSITKCNFGVVTRGTVSTTGTGTITIDGIGGGSGSSANANRGAYINGNLSTASGTISITGQGGGTTASASNSTNNVGVVVKGGSVTTTSGNVSITGTGGYGVGHGVQIDSTGAVSAGGNLTITGTAENVATAYGILFEGTASSSGTTTLTTSDSIVDGSSGYLVTDKLAIANASSVTLNHTSTDIDTLAASGIGSLTLVDKDDLIIGSVNPTGISSTGTISITTLSGNLTVSENISTTDTSTNAVILNAGKNTAAGTSNGGNIIISSSPTITMGTGGRATLYTGSISGSTGLTTFIGSGSGDFRYNSDEASTGFSTSNAALSSGTYAIYREQPTVSYTANNASMTYGDSTPTLTQTMTGSLQNGDTATSTTPSITNASTSTAGHYEVGSHTLTPQVGNLGDLGYGLTATNGTLTVNAKTITVSNFAVSDKTYDGNYTTTLTGTINGVVSGDTVNLASATFADSNVGTGKAISISGNGLTGADANNYSISLTTTGHTADISQLSSVTWTGGATGNWHDASNWAGNAVPSLSNVAAVSIPSGTTVTFDPTGASAGVSTGNVSVDGISGAGNLTVAGGDLTVGSAHLTLTGLTQSAGSLTSDGNVTVDNYNYSGGTQDLNGNLTVSADFVQAAAISAVGNIAITDADIAINNDITVTGSGNRITLTTPGNIDVAANSDITTNGGAVVLWSNTDGGSSNAHIALRGNTSITTNGGHLWMGGSSTNNGSTTWSGLTVGDGFAIGGTTISAPANHKLGLLLEDTTINTDGGNIRIAGDSSSNGTVGIATLGTVSLDSGTGTIEIEGKQTGGNYAGVEIGFHDSTINSSLSITSAAVGTSGSPVTAISIIGSSNGITSGVSFNGNAEISATGTGAYAGGINITGTAINDPGIQIAGYYDGIAKILSTAGAITLDGGSTGVAVENGHNRTSGPVLTSELILGSESGHATVANSSADIALIGDTFTSNANGMDIRTSGEVSITSSGGSFSSTLSTDSISLSSDVSGLTLGKSTNTSNIILAEATSISGDVAMYGADITVAQNLDTSVAAGANVLVKATGDIVLATNKSVSTDGGNVTFWADSDASGSLAYIELDDGYSITTNGGDIVLAGGLDDGANGGTANDGFPDGYAAGKIESDTSSNIYAGVFSNDGTLDTRVSGSLNANAGNILIRGKGTQTNGSVTHGVQLWNTKIYTNDFEAKGTVTSTAASNNYYGVAANGAVSPNNTVLRAYGDITLTGDMPTPNSQWAVRWGTNHEMYTTAGSVNINATGKLLYLSSQTLTFAAGEALVFDSNYSAEWRNTIAGAGGIVKKGTGTLELSRASSFTGPVDLEGGTLEVTNGSGLGGGTSTVNVDSGTTLELHGVSVSKDFSLNGGLLKAVSGSNTISGDITLGANSTFNVSGTKLTLGGVISGAYDVTKTGSGTLAMTNDNTYTGSTTISAGAFEIGAGSTGSLATSALTNNGSTLKYLLGQSTTIDYPITSSAPVSITTTSGNITLADNISTTNTGTSAIVVNAGKNTAAGTATGGNIVISGSPTFTTGTGGRVTLYTGSINGSTGLTNFIGSGSGNFRYNSDESSTGYSTSNAAIGAGTYAIYREQPTVSYTAADANMTYGGSTPVLTQTRTGSLQNGDTATSTTPVVTGATTSTSGNYQAGTWSIVPQVGNLGDLGYGLSATNGTLTVAKKTLSVSYTGTDRVYDATTNVTVTDTVTGVVTNDVVGISESASFTDKHIGTGKTVNVTNMVLSGADAGNYALASTSTTTSADVTAKSITVNYTGTDKIYDGNTLATVTSAGWISGDAVSTSESALFVDKNKANGKTISVSNISLSGNDANNYTLVNSTATTTANITARTVTLNGATGISKTYDGLTSMPAGQNGYGSFVNAIAGDDLQVSGVPTFNTANAGNNTIVQNTVALAGTDASNYSLNWVDGSGTINKAPLTITANNDAKFVTQSDVSNFAGASYSGFVNNETSTDLTGALTVTRSNSSQQLAGSYANVLEASGFTSNNYQITYVKGDYDIVAANQLLVKVNDAVSTYGTNQTYVISSAKYMNGSNSIIDLTSNVSASGNGITITDGSGGSAAFTLVADSATTSTAGYVETGSYTIAADSVTTTSNNFSSTLTITGNHTVNKKPLSIAYSAANKVYDATDSVTVTETLTGVVTSDLISITESASFVDKNATTGKAVNISGITMAGTDAANYQLNTSFTPVTADITQKALNFNYSASDKVYDANTNASVNANLTGVITGDTVNISETASFADQHAANNKTVSVSNIQITGTDAGNYSLPATTDSTTSSITKKLLSLAYSGVNKVYDALTGANVVDSLTGMINGDTVTVSETASFADKNVANGKTVSISNIALGGSEAGNYRLANTSMTTSADITAKPLGLSYVAADKTYDGNTNVTVTDTLTGVISGDTVQLGETAVFVSDQAGTGHMVNITNVAISGGDAANYSLPFNSTTVTADINQRVVNLSGNTNVNKIYDGTTAMPSNNLGYGSLANVVSGDNLSISGSPVYANANVGSHAINLGTIALAGSDAANYSLNWSNGSGSISKAALTVTANDDAKFVTHNDVTNFAGVSFAGFVNGESVNDLGGTLAISRSNSSVQSAGNYSGVLNASGYTSGNYQISYVAGDYTIVPANELLVRVTDVSSTYGSNQTYTVASAKYMDGSNTIQDLSSNISATGNNISLSDGAGGSTSFSLAPANASNSSSGYLQSGTYSIEAGTVNNTSANFNNSLFVVGSHTVNQKPLSISYAGSNKIYDGTTAATVTETLTGGVSGDTLNISETANFANQNAATGIGVNITAITLGGTDAANYALNTSHAAVTADINTRAVTVTADDQEKNIGRTDPALTYTTNTATSTTGLVSGETLTGTLTRVAGELVGDYAIQQGTLTNTNNANYSITYVAGKLEVKANNLVPTIPAPAVPTTGGGSGGGTTTGGTTTGGTTTGGTTTGGTTSGGSTSGGSTSGGSTSGGSTSGGSTSGGSTSGGSTSGGSTSGGSTSGGSTSGGSSSGGSTSGGSTSGGSTSGGSTSDGSTSGGSTSGGSTSGGSTSGGSTSGGSTSGGSTSGGSTSGGSTSGGSTSGSSGSSDSGSGSSTSGNSGSGDSGTNGSGSGDSSSGGSTSGNSGSSDSSSGSSTSGNSGSGDSGTIDSDSGDSNSGSSTSGSSNSSDSGSGGSTSGSSGSSDSGSADSGSGDSGSGGSGSGDSGSGDSGSNDSGSADSGSTDSGSADSGSGDSGSGDSGSSDTGSDTSSTSGTDNADNRTTTVTQNGNTVILPKNGKRLINKKNVEKALSSDGDSASLDLGALFGDDTTNTSTNTANTNSASNTDGANTQAQTNNQASESTSSANSENTSENNVASNEQAQFAETEVLMFEDQQAAGTIKVTQAGETLTATINRQNSTQAAMPTLTEVRYTQFDYQSANNQTEVISVGISTENTLIIMVPDAIKATMDERHIVLLAIAIAKRDLDVDIDNVASVIMNIGSEL